MSRLVKLMQNQVAMHLSSENTKLQLYHWVTQVRGNCSTLNYLTYVFEGS